MVIQTCSHNSVFIGEVKINVTAHFGQNLLFSVQQMNETKFNLFVFLFVCVCVCVVQAHPPLLHISVFVQRGFPQSMSEWRTNLWTEPQLETSHQPAVADVSSDY